MMSHSTDKPRMGAPFRHLLTILGLIMLALGALGAVLPLLPTTPFLLAAIACFSRSFPRLETWLLNHPRFGSPLRAWRRHGAIPAKAKVFAIVSMLVSYAVFLTTSNSGLPLQIGLALVLSCCSTFILSRPTVPRPQRAMARLPVSATASPPAR